MTSDRQGGIGLSLRRAPGRLEAGETWLLTGRWRTHRTAVALLAVSLLLAGTGFAVQRLAHEGVLGWEALRIGGTILILSAPTGGLAARALLRARRR